MADLAGWVADRRDALVRAWLTEYGSTEGDAELSSAVGRALDDLHAALLTRPAAMTSSVWGDLRVDPLAATRAIFTIHKGMIAPDGDRPDVTAEEHGVLASWLSALITAALAAEEVRRDNERHQVAHELRNPLSSAVMASSLLRPRLPNEDALRLASTLERNLHRIEELINERVARPRSR